jgi:nucleotide-binding universal stress UspA family protein
VNLLIPPQHKSVEHPTVADEIPATGGRNMQSPELVMEHTQPPLDGTAVPSGIKSMLFHIHDDDGLDDRLQIALTLARTFGAHLHLLHVIPIEAYAAPDGFTAFVTTDLVDVLEREAATLKGRLEQHLKSEDVSWDYEKVIGSLEPRLIQRAALADLIVLGREPYSREFGPAAITLLGDLLHRSRTPLLVPGDGRSSFDPFGSAMIAWNGRYEAANAVRSAVPMLKLASKVRVVSVEEATDQQFPSTAVLEYLSRHGIHAELVQRPQLADTIQEELLDQATSDRAAYIVLGGYGHTRAGELLFGGVTRSLLQRCPISLMIAH